MNRRSIGGPRVQLLPSACPPPNECRTVTRWLIVGLWMPHLRNVQICLEWYGALALRSARKESENGRSYSRGFQKIKNYWNRLRIRFFGAAPSWWGLVKMTKSLNFRHENPGSEPETVPSMKNPPKTRKVFLIILSQFSTYRSKILNSTVKLNLICWKKRNFRFSNFFIIFEGLIADCMVFGAQYSILSSKYHAICNKSFKNDEKIRKSKIHFFSTYQI